MTVDIVYQKKDAAGKLTIRHDRWIQGTADDYDTFSEADNFPITVNQSNDYNCMHPDVVYYGQHEWNSDDDVTYRYLFCVYELFGNSGGTKGNREIWWAKYDEQNHSWGYGRTKLYDPDGNHLPMYPRIDTGMDDTAWGGIDGHISCVLWHTYEYSGSTIIDIDIWGSFFPPLSPSYLLVAPITWTAGDADLDEYNRWDVFPYVDIDPYENTGTRATHLVWTHFKNSNDTDPTNFYWNTEMEVDGYDPVTIHDDGDAAVQEGLITYAARVHTGGSRLGCATWIDDRASNGVFPVYASQITSTTTSSINHGTRVLVSTGVSDDNWNGVYAPVPAIRHRKTAHIGWSDWDSIGTDWGIYADWNMY